MIARGPSIPAIELATPSNRRFRRPEGATGAETGHGEQRPASVAGDRARSLCVNARPSWARATVTQHACAAHPLGGCMQPVTPEVKTPRAEDAAGLRENTGSGLSFPESPPMTIPARPSRPAPGRMPIGLPDGRPVAAGAQGEAHWNGTSRHDTAAYAVERSHRRSPRSFSRRRLGRVRTRRDGLGSHRSLPTHSARRALPTTLRTSPAAPRLSDAT